LHILTPRLRLRLWRDSDRRDFAALNADPDVMRDLGGPISAEDSDAKLERYKAIWENQDMGRWVIETREGLFLGYTGIMPAHSDHPLGEHYEAGWRLLRFAWGNGYASEASRAALDDAFGRLGLSEILAYTAADNVRSQALITRLGFARDKMRDFTLSGPRGTWQGLVWAAKPIEQTALP
jgi:RimJ/RimL family protein N-acetyltransferase